MAPRTDNARMHWLEPDTIPVELLLQAYRNGAFPMARSRHGDVDFFVAPERCLLPLAGANDPADALLAQMGHHEARFHIRRSLARAARRHSLNMQVDVNFAAVIAGCAAAAPGREDTWISPLIERTYTALHRLGHAHCISAWDAAGHLVGGVYGLAIGQVFFAESMFSRQAWASQLCLLRLREELCRRGFRLWDAQVMNPHLAQFGAVTVPHAIVLPHLRHLTTTPPAWFNPQV